MYKLNRSLRETDAERAWDQDTAAFLLSSFPTHFSALGTTEDDLERLAALARQTAQVFQVRQGNQIRRLAVAMVALGAFMTDDPRFWSGVHAALSDYHTKDQTRLGKVSANAQAWTLVLWENDSLDRFGQRATDALRAPGAVPKSGGAPRRTTPTAPLAT